MNRTLPQSYRVILVEDDLELAELIKDFLNHYEFDVTIITDGLQAVDRILNAKPDLVILDIMLPGQSGMEVCRAIREQYRGMILMQTALDDDIDQMMGLELGADDYVVKQVKPRLLLSRIRALLRRQERNTQGDKYELRIGSLWMNLQHRVVLLAQSPVRLTTSEFELLYLLAQNVGTIVTRDDIAQQIRGFEYDGLDRSIDRRISRLRRALNDDPNEPRLIKTIRGRGYQLCAVQEGEWQ
ncbi:MULTISPECIES: winged helix-turn-helix domain-containing protein [Vibrio]|uniref:winged helix-turn-helix domain-containing protein n=1 Tax=Vibrio TaxID=662 RepID=UPI000497BDD1|nr:MULTISPECIES: winged helix-turn-helix domain-containing protein [Vibrio]MCO7013213.1 winged helix-turn-helix domain-containing protein [Vibrio paracholerae]MCO7016895.1 winged helix-turn-helix domain-containing protein [Vibrio paracholerae]MCO7023217.1 winged helix-turn-helix domain-containing protein [Vibrio paracholerae]MCO7033500.1 winged helix-turn-helix domain-containing protein [Vibrio paracholerae]MCO7047258.1 winged helix-turn-helix domain-containing protein [Vibrio paracholerae]